MDNILIKFEIIIQYTDFISNSLKFEVWKTTKYHRFLNQILYDLTHPVKKSGKIDNSCQVWGGWSEGKMHITLIILV